MNRRIQTKSVNKVVTRIEEEEFGYWGREEEGFVSIDISNMDEVKAAAKTLGCSEAMVDMLGLLFSSLQEAIAKDLVDIWQRT